MVKLTMIKAVNFNQFRPFIVIIRNALQVLETVIFVKPAHGRTGPPGFSQAARRPSPPLLGAHKCPCQMASHSRPTALLGCLSLTAVSSFMCVCVSVCVHPTVQYILPQRSKLLHLAAVWTCYGITDRNLLRLIAYTLYGGLCRRLWEISMLLSK